MEKQKICYLLDRTLLEIKEMLTRKMQSYKNSYFETRSEFGKLVFLIRIIDKINRLKALIDQENSHFFEETYQDTIKDVIGYCLLELIFEKIKKEGKNETTNLSS